MCPAGHVQACTTGTGDNPGIRNVTYLGYVGGHSKSECSTGAVGQVAVDPQGIAAGAARGHGPGVGDRPVDLQRAGIVNIHISRIDQAAESGLIASTVDLEGPAVV